jgi:hypothetical protein
MKRSMWAPRDTPDWLEGVRLSRTDWRVSDARVPAAEPGYLLGYVERLLRDRYEILWMTDPMRWAYTDSLDAALKGLAEGARFTGSTQVDRDIPALRAITRTPYRVHRRTSVAKTRATYVA